MGLFHIIWIIIVGFVVGLLGRAVMPGADNLGFMTTTLLGIAGSFVGGFLGSLVSKPAADSKFHPAGFLLSIVGAVVLLFLWRFIH